MRCGIRGGAAVALVALGMLAGRPAVAGAQAASELYREGIAHLRAGRAVLAREPLEAAVAAEPERADYRVALAAALLRIGDARGARSAVDRALELDPASAPARELSGDLHYRDGSLNLALGEWEAAAAAGGSVALAAKLAQGRRDVAAEQGLGRETSRNFVILFDAGVPRQLVRDFFALLDEAFEVLHDRLGGSPRDDITVILYSRQAFRETTRAPAWSGGIYDGKIRVPVGGLETTREAAGLLGTLVHEMTHAFLHRLAPEGLPRWFQEGLATLAEGREPESARRFLAEHAPGAFASFADLDAGLLGMRGDVRGAYAAALLAVAAIVEMRGEGALRGIISGVGAGRPFAEVLEDEARATPAELEDRWRRALP